MAVPVIDHAQHLLMPTTPARARRWVQTDEATPFWQGGIWCVCLNQDPAGRSTQPLAVCIDHGSKKEALVVKSAAHTYLTVQADAIVRRVATAFATRRTMRCARRFRHTPCRQPQANRLRYTTKLPPSTRARWQWRLRLCQWLTRRFPITAFTVEDITAVTKGQRRWERCFSPLEVGKQWLYQEVGMLALVRPKAGWETPQLRDGLGLSKSKQQLAETSEAHSVDAWVLSWAAVGGQPSPEQTCLLCLLCLPGRPCSGIGGSSIACSLSEEGAASPLAGRAAWASCRALWCSAPSAASPTWEAGWMGAAVCISGSRASGSARTQSRRSAVSGPF